MLCASLMCFFFFQAEDGIRDLTVTGVQTCALPISYDIRGIVPSTLNEEVALGVGRAFGMAALAAGETVVAVGRDGRLSGPSLSAALIAGLTEVGIEVIDIGLEIGRAHV